MGITHPKRASQAMHGGVFLGAVALTTVALPRSRWPWYFLLPLLVYFAIVFVLPPLRRSFRSLSIGRLDRLGVAAAVALSLLTSVALVAYQALERPDVTTLAAGLRIETFGSLVLVGVYFSLLNAVLEEVIFRGVLYEAVAAEWGPAVAVAATAVCFGVGHMHGYPPGLLGAFLAGLYGVALGLLRWWSGGLALTVGCHVCADATIFTILVTAGAFPEVSG
jgi:membrane protease YdiL (CAAX protease family)